MKDYRIKGVLWGVITFLVFTAIQASVGKVIITTPRVIIYLTTFVIVGIVVEKIRSMR